MSYSLTIIETTSTTIATASIYAMNLQANHLKSPFIITQ